MQLRQIRLPSARWLWVPPVWAGLLLFLAACSPVEPPSAHLLAEARGEQCVEPTDFMRREHMNLLMVERDQAKRYGIRNVNHSFVGCIDCHVSPAASQADPANHFCLACHAFNAVRMDCFQCHLDRPYAPDPAGRTAGQTADPHAGLQAVQAGDALWLAPAKTPAGTTREPNPDLSLEFPEAEARVPDVTYAAWPEFVAFGSPSVATTSP